MFSATVEILSDSTIPPSSAVRGSYALRRREGDPSYGVGLRFLSAVRGSYALRRREGDPSYGVGLLFGLGGDDLCEQVRGIAVAHQVRVALAAVVVHTACLVVLPVLDE